MKQLRIFLILLAWCWCGLRPAAAREANLINNAAFVHGMKCWRHTGPGKAETPGKGVRLTDGVLHHYLDQGNLEHAQPDCAAPAGRPFRFSVKARGDGILKLGVRSRRMYGGNAVEFSEQWSGEIALSETTQVLEFVDVTTDPDTVFHDKLMIAMVKPGVAEILATRFVYLDRQGPELSFFPEAAIVRPGDTVRVTLHSSRPGLKLACSLYPGQFVLGGYFPARHWEVVVGADGRTEFSFVVPSETPDGARLSVLETSSGVKANFFATIMPKKQLARYRKIAAGISGRRHLLFLGDSLSDYDRGRNYISTLQCFLPSGFTVRNCGVGGDTLKRILQRLRNEKTTRNEMYDRIFAPKPDTIFIFTGANDSKLTSSSGFRQTYVPENEQTDLWEKIIAHLKEHTGAKIVLVTSPDSYMPFQNALNEPLRARGMPHSYFGRPEVHDRFNARLRRVAAKHGLDVIDFAAEVRAHPDPQLLYVQDDGVHLSLKGHQLLAGAVLRYLATGETPKPDADPGKIAAAGDRETDRDDTAGRFGPRRQKEDSK